MCRRWDSNRRISVSGVQVPEWREVAGGFFFPEAPRWFDGALWLSDIHAHTVCRVDARGEVRVVARLDDRPSGLGFLPDGTPLVVSMIDRRLLRITPSGVREHADLRGHCDGFLNDMVVDNRGVAYVGARNRAGEQPRDTIVRVSRDGEVSIAAPHMQSPNGSVVTPDGAMLIVAETSLATLTSFAIAADGALHDRQVWAHVPGAHPDGICVDDDGAIWFGSPVNHEFVRVQRGGEVTHRWPTSTHWAIACAIGGPDHRTLYGLVGRNSVENIVGLGDERERDGESDANGSVLARRLPLP